MRKIDITGIDLIEAVKAAYRLSRPQGMGFLHYREGDLSDDTARGLIRADGSVSLDYVSGRACKFRIWMEGERLFTTAHWFDHSDVQQDELLTGLGIDQSTIDAARAPASVDTHPEGGDGTKIPAPFMGGAVPAEEQADAPKARS